MGKLCPFSGSRRIRIENHGLKDCNCKSQSAHCTQGNNLFHLSDLIPRSFIRVSFVVEAGKHPDGILVFVDYKIKGMRKSFEFQGTDVFMPNPEERVRYQRVVTSFECSNKIYGSIGAI